MGTNKANDVNNVAQFILVTEYNDKHIQRTKRTVIDMTFQFMFLVVVLLLNI